jgi:hypothetical protein
MDVSDAIIADSLTDDIRCHGYLKRHWYDQIQNITGIESVLVEPRPTRIGENDVDTVIHLMLARHGGDNIFEGMCNPPGGDWSGISFLSTNRDFELRWLTLPRVSDTGAKRPDHVFQLFRTTGLPIILSVESKETAASVETTIGPRLTSYVQTLLQTPASIQRPVQSLSWLHSAISLDTRNHRMASAVAFISNDEAQIENVRNRAEVDLLMCFVFQDAGEKCLIKLIPTTSLGAEITSIILALPLNDTGIIVSTDVHQ